MKVRYIQGMGEPRGPGIKPGDERDVPANEGERLVAKGIAVAASAKAGSAKKAQGGKGGTKASAKAGSAKKAA